MSSDNSLGNGGPQRIADSLLRSLGGRSVLLRLPMNAIPDSDQEQLGLMAPLFNDVELAPVVYRRSRATMETGRGAQYELLVSAKTVEGLIGSMAFNSAETLFATATGVVAGQMLLQIVAVSSSEVFGRAYLYRLLLRESVALSI
jgi:hypothetical protein